MRYRLRSLLILLAVAPPLLAAAWWLAGDESRRSATIAHARWILPALAALIGFPVALAFVASLIAGAITRKP
jgi:hypothetical protein